MQSPGIVEGLRWNQRLLIQPIMNCQELNNLKEIAADVTYDKRKLVWKIIK